MMRRLSLALVILLVALSANPLLARDTTGVVRLRTAPSSLDPTRAYILFRSSRARSGLFSIEHVFLRVLTSGEVAAWEAARQAAYEAALPSLQRRANGGIVPNIDEFPFVYDGPQNTFTSRSGDFLVDGEDMRTHLLEVHPGNYIIYGASVANNITTCNCLGTVRFEARAGIITNIGSLYADKAHNDSPMPYIEDNVGPSMARYSFMLGQAVVPAAAADVLPQELRALPVQGAEFHVVGLFRDPTAQTINRLAPIPGILAYDRGRVIDVRTGAAAGSPSATRTR